MKVLFFHAVAGHPKVVLPLLDQTRSTLRPFKRYLGQAIHTAKQRQFRYQLPWERVVDLVTITLEPMDSVLRIPRRIPGMLLADWPAGQRPDPSKPAFVINRSEVVRIDTVQPSPRGLLVTTTPPLHANDRLMWCERQCTAVAPEAAPAPRSVVDLEGRALVMLGPPTEDGPNHWCVRVEGLVGDGRICVDGKETAAERVSTDAGPKRVLDEAQRSFDVSGMLIRAEDPPVEGALAGDDGLRYRWSTERSRGRRGCWVRLLLPEDAEIDEFLDPRAAFCEGDVREVWTQPRHNERTIFKVRRVDPDRYQLQLDRLPPEGSTLYLPVDLRSLYLQKRALHQLAEAPLPHHQGLLRLCEDPERVRWPTGAPVTVEDGQWRSLTDETRSGTLEQRRFVEKALGTPDLAFLEGPPGSGKTTAICELVQQLVEAGQRVLLCASTNVAIDNVLERLLDDQSPIDAVRIGRLERVDDTVRETQLDARVEALVDAWRREPTMSRYAGPQLAEMARRTVVMAANLTCGTTMGIVNHPLFHGRDKDLHASERPITTMPHWDVLIVDEASKTLIQELMVPALMAKRWIIVGDVHQLPPFADRADIVANLRELVDEDERPLFPPDHQRACLLIFRMMRRRVRQEGMRWLLVEPPSVLTWIERELAGSPVDELSVVQVVHRSRPSLGPVTQVTVEQLRSGAPEALALAAADWILVGDDLLAEVAGSLPANLLLTSELGPSHGELPETDALRFRQGYWLERAGRVHRAYRDERSRRDDVRTMADAQGCEIDWLARQDLAQQLAWRLTRIHELRHSNDGRERERLADDLDDLVPYAVDISDALAEIEDIGLPSIIEVLQEGIGKERSKRPSSLTLGFRTSCPGDFEARFESLRYQHRMHPTISSFPRELIYGGRALVDANTIEQRDRRLGWDFNGFSSRRVWMHVAGREHKGVNDDEVEAIIEVVRDFIAWAEGKGPPSRGTPGTWEVACLSFYAKQERALSQALQQLTGDERKTRFAPPDAPVEIVCGTVDRFQGREADLVLLSLRNTRRVGFLDSPNRLNVAVTRARQQLVIVGNADYFARCGVAELQELVQRSPRANRATAPRRSRRRR